MESNKMRLNFKDIGIRIRLERERLNLTREKFAEIVELSSFYIGQIERGDRKMSLDTLVKIADTLHMSTDYLLFGTKIHNKELEIDKSFSVLENVDESYNLEFDNEIKELLSLLTRCSIKEVSLIKDMAKLIIPHITK